MSDAHQVILSPEAKRAIERLKRATGADTTSQVMCQAVGLYLWALENHERGIAIGTISETCSRVLQLFSDVPEKTKTTGKPALRLVR